MSTEAKPLDSAEILRLMANLCGVQSARLGELEQQQQARCQAFALRIKEIAAKAPAAVSRADIHFVNTHETAMDQLHANQLFAGALRTLLFVASAKVHDDIACVGLSADLQRALGAEPKP